MKPLKTGDPCPCCGMPIKSTKSGNASPADRISGTLGSACATLKERWLF